MSYRTEVKARVREAADEYGTEAEARARVLELGMNPDRWVKILHSWRTPTDREFAIIAVAFDVSACWLLNGYEDE